MEEFYEGRVKHRWEGRGGDGIAFGLVYAGGPGETLSGYMSVSVLRSSVCICDGFKSPLERADQLARILQTHAETDKVCFHAP
jgi:hypothetical protein